MVSIDNMMVYLKVVESRSFTAAARELGIGKARVSQIVSELEQALGIRLLNRTTRSLSLTDAGARYVEKCQQIRELVEQANSETITREDEPAGVLRVSAPLHSTVLNTFFCDFLQRYPKIRLEVQESDSYLNLIESRTDVAIRASASLEDSRLYATKIGEFQDVLCASADYLDRHPPVTSCQQLLQLDWLAHEIVQKDRQLVLHDAEGKLHKLSMQPRVMVSSAASLKQFIQSGIGFGVLPSFMIRSELESGELVQLLPEMYGDSIPFYAVYQEKALMPLRVRVFLQHLKQQGDLFS